CSSAAVVSNLQVGFKWMLVLQHYAPIQALSRVNDSDPMPGFRRLNTDLVGRAGVLEFAGASFLNLLPKFSQ
ncbi:hypothetical protein, partial [Neorhizobium galegae]|uniref:hypothetical protein n=1 Tax=Neorhizobium galegae TaxID=399 RepID=UPI0021027969